MSKNLLFRIDDGSTRRLPQITVDDKTDRPIRESSTYYMRDLRRAAQLANCSLDDLVRAIVIDWIDKE